MAINENHQQTQEPQQQTTNFIENPMEAHQEVIQNTPINLQEQQNAPINLQEQQMLVPLIDHENEFKRLSHANRLSSLDSIFDNNLVISHDNENFDVLENDTVLVRYDSSDSYFDKM